MFALIKICRFRISLGHFAAGTGMIGEVRVEMVMVLDVLFREKNGTSSKYKSCMAHVAVSVRI
jgi:hypothetical protein